MDSPLIFQLLLLAPTVDPFWLSLSQGVCLSKVNKTSVMWFQVHSILKSSVVQAPDVFSISMLPEEGNSLRCASVLGYLNFLKVYNSSKSQMCMDAQSSCQNGIDSQANMADSHPPCIIEIDLENGCIQAPESEEEAIESLKREGLLTVSYEWSSFNGLSFIYLE